jgi:hypothetical protein
MNESVGAFTHRFDLLNLYTQTYWLRTTHETNESRTHLETELVGEHRRDKGLAVVFVGDGRGG